MIIQNKMTLYLFIHSSIVGTIYIVLGWESVKYQAMYTFWGIFFMEQVNYIEHYGL